MYLFPQYAPDRAEYDPTVMGDMCNAFPRAGSYSPVPSLVPFSNALPGEPRGFVNVRAPDDSFASFAATKTNLYRYNQGTMSWDDVSGPSAPYNLADGENWSFSQFGTELHAVNQNDPQQVLDLTGGVFADLGGNPPKAAFTMVSGAFLFMLDLEGNDDGLAWSGRNRSNVWTSGQFNSDAQNFRDGGRVVGGAGGQSGGVIFQKDAIRLMTFQPSSQLTFSFTKMDLERGRGCIAPGSIVTVNRSVYFLDENGFYRYTDGQVVPIGDERVDAFIRRDAQNTKNVLGTADIGTKSIYWRYRSVDQANTEPLFETDKILGYEWEIDRWFLIKIRLRWLANAATSGYTLDGLNATGYNLDTLPYSLDSNVWKGGEPVVAGIDENNRMGYFQGPNMAAQLESADLELIRGRRTMVQGFRVISDTTEAQGSIGTKEYLGQQARWRNAVMQSPREGVIRQRASGRLHRARVSIPAGTTWNHMSGVDFQDPQDDGA